MPDAEREPRRPNHLTWRHRLLAAGIALGLAALLVRLAFIQVVDHERYAEEVANARLGAAIVPAPRGAILDASGYPLASSIDTWDVYIDSFLWRDRERASEAAIALGAELQLNPDALFASGTARDRGDLLVLRQLEYFEGAALRDRGLWGVRLLPSSRRVYAEQDLAGPLIGFVGLDGSGLWGVEADFDHVLRGHPGRVVAEQDPLGRPIAFAPRSERTPLAGGEVQLTIDPLHPGDRRAAPRGGGGSERSERRHGDRDGAEHGRDPRDGLAARGRALDGRPRRRGAERAGCATARSPTSTSRARC